ncbi:Metal tolerance protein A1 [Cucumispora dikerogammari]|nr:Metal tolerance protein A1 [Cucumispora dikerogammari]
MHEKNSIINDPGFIKNATNSITKNKLKTTGCKDKLKEDIKKISHILIFSSLFIIIELYGHFKSNSLALLADAIHLIVDVLGYIISLISLLLIKKGRNNQKNFGYLKLEPLGSLFSIVLIWMALLHLFIKAVNRIQQPSKIKGKNFIIVGIFGCIFNFINLYILGHKHCNLNMKTVYIHLIGDIIQTTGILFTSLITYFYPKLFLVDSLCTLVCGTFVVVSSLGVSKEAVWLLLDSFPKDVDDLKLREELLKVECVEEIIDLKIFAQTTEIYVLNVRVKANVEERPQYDKVKNGLYSVIHSNSKFVFVNVEIN